MTRKTIKMRLTRVFLVFLSALTVVTPAFGLSGSTEDKFAQNDILFYQPDGSDGYCATAYADCNIIGETKDEKLWSGLRHVGFTPKQTAAIMGNMAHEGGSPTRQEDAYSYARDRGCMTQNGQPYTIWTDYNTDGLRHSSCMQGVYNHYSAGKEVAGIGLGFVQWTSTDRRLGYLEKMRELGLIDYFDGDAYKEYGKLTDEQLQEKIVAVTGSDADYWALWCAAIKFVRAEMDGGYKEFYNVTDDVSSLASWVSAKYEICNGCAVGQSSHNARVASAVQYYNDYLSGAFDAVESGTAPSATPGANADEDGTNVTIIGDSITVGANFQILEKMPNAEIHAQDSKSFNTTSGDNKSGIAIAEELKAAGTLRKNVVFALGTNNKGGVGADAIKELAETTLGRGYTVYLVSNYDDHDTSIYATNNSQFTQAAAVYNNVHLIDWASAVTAAKADNPDVTYIKDEWDAAGYSVHPTEDGSKLFAETLYGGITGTSASAGGCDTVADPGDALSYLQQFITDTNYLYGRSYTIPQRAEIGVNTNTPGSDEPVAVIGSVQQSWIAQGLISDTDGLGGCWRATFCGQCTALSGWFVTMMTDYTYGGGNGIEVVSKLLVENAGGNVSETPIPFSVFSDTGSGSSAGHTGIVLGEMDDGSWLTIENNMGNHDLKVLKRTNFAEKNGRFYDVSDKLKLDHLGKTYD
ncbi:MAG: phage tail tip lysozyme [Candidatus Saccharimonadales bacterium]